MPQDGKIVVTSDRADVRTLGSFAACGLVFSASVAATIYFCNSMAGEMKMPGGWRMSMMWMRMPGQTWLASAAMFLLMWLAMMVAMMLPSAMPEFLSSDRSLSVDRKSPIAQPVLLMFAGYFTVWLVAGAMVYPVGAALAVAAMRSEWVSRLVPMLSGASLIIAGAIQFTRLKMSALGCCRRPLSCATRAKTGVVSWRHGIKQGIACVVCCSGPMLALCVIGAMNFTAMLVIAVVIGFEKLGPKPEFWARIFGIVGIIAGGIALVKPF